MLQRGVCPSWASSPCRSRPPRGKASHLERQRGFIELSNILRHRLIDVLGSAEAPPRLPAPGR